MRKLLLILGIAFINNIQAADLAIPNTFTAGTTAVAAEVNANFTAVESAVDDNNTNITTNASGISTSASDIATNTANITINTSNIANIDSRVSMLEVTYLIGDIGPAGGWVFYVTGDGLHGLEAAPVDQASSTWGCIVTDILGAESTAIGTGARNTDDIIRGCSTAGIAAAVADEYISPSGYIDWYLPSMDELNEMYLNIGPGSAPPVNVGGFASDIYWSSSEFSNNGALGQRFNIPPIGFQADALKDSPLGVRAVRAF